MGAWRKYDLDSDDRARLQRAESLPAAVTQFMRCNVCGYEFRKNRAGRVIGSDVVKHKATHRHLKGDKL